MPIMPTMPKHMQAGLACDPSRRRSLQRISALALAVVASPLSYAGAYDDFFHAVKIDDVAEVRSLLARGLDPNIVEPERGDNGLILALREGSSKVFETLLAARGIDVNLKSRNGDDALMIAAYKGNKPAVEALLRKGAEVNRPGWTPLHYAAAIGNEDIVRILIGKSAFLDARSPNNTTPLMMAARSGHIMTVKLLFDAGADATLKNEHGMNAIDFANKNNHKDIAEGLTYRLKKAGKL
jgi:ankyrin repeat protein